MLVLLQTHTHGSSLNKPSVRLVCQAAASIAMTKEENVELQEKERHDREDQQEGRGQGEEEEEAVTEEEEEAEEEDDEDEYELEDEKEDDDKLDVDDDEEEQEDEERQDRQEKEESTTVSDIPAQTERQPLPASGYQSPVQEPRHSPMVHPAAQAPLPEDYSTSSLL